MTDPTSNQPPARKKTSSAEQPTIITDFSSETAGTPAPQRADQQTQHSDLSGNDGVSNESMVTKVMTGAPRASEPTKTTDLHVPGGSGTSSKVSSGTHHHQIWGDFELGDLLGRGGMGSVYRGRQISLDRPVAVKVLPSHLSENENFRSRFLLEARAVAKLNSPHVVGVFFAGVHEGHHYFAMEYVEGKDLAVRLRDGFKPKHLDALKIVTQACRGLAVASDMGLVHRDIKPANMMVTNKGIVKLMDFGLVRAAKSDDTGLTMAGTIMGTVSYFSPEQGRGEKCDCRTDIYALGIVFYELLTGQLPFTGGDATSVIYQHIHAEPKPPKEIDPSIPEAYQAVVLKCLQKKADDRYKDAHALIDDLTALANGQSPFAATHNLKSLRSGGTIVKEQAFHAEKRRRAMWIAACLLVIVGIGGTATYVAKNPHQQLLPWANPIMAQLMGTATETTGPTSGPTQLLVPKTNVDITAARSLLAAGHLEQCRVLVDKALITHPQDAEWKTLNGDLSTAQGVSAIGQAETALSQNDILASTAALSAATIYLGSDDERVSTMQTRLNTKTAERKERTRVLAEAESLISEGEWKKAESLLAPLAAKNATDEEVSVILRRTRKLNEDQAARMKAVGERTQQGEEALARKDLDAALLHFTAAQQLDPKNAMATKGLEEVTKGQAALTALRERFQLAIKARDLAAAESSLADMRRIAPGSSTLVLAENEFTNSKLVEENKAKAMADQKAATVEAALALEKRINDSQIPVTTLEQEVAAFIKEHGEKPAQQAGLATQLEDRRQQTVVIGRLKQLDDAVVTKDDKRIAAIVTSTEFKSALHDLGTMSGLVFTTSMQSFKRTDNTATATVEIRHALTTFPERTLTMVYTMNRSGDLWTITEAALQ